MGYLTTIVVHNDALGTFEDHPKEFGDAIFEGISRAQTYRQVQSCPFPFGGYANYIHVHPSRHADDHTIYVHYGNGVFELNGYSKDYKQLCLNNPDLAARMINVARAFVDEAERVLKETQKKK